MKAILPVGVLLSAFLAQTTAAASSPAAADLWSLARQQSGIHRFSTLFTAQDVRGRLANESGLGAALDWCKRTAVTQVYIECFRDVQVLPVKGDPKSLLAMPQEALDRLRQPLLRPFKTSFRAPNQVGLYLFKDGSWVIENFNDQPAEVELNGRKLAEEPRGWQKMWVDR